jgi:23S rRNA (pseudouridine1915-N3)-methyltransferase
MKFSEISSEVWDANQMFLDTCLLPITALTGTETPMEITMALEKLRDVMEPIEVTFRGRLVTYPAFHYISEDNSFQTTLVDLTMKLKQTPFRYVLIVSTDNILEKIRVTSADAILTREEVNSGSFKSIIMNVWQSSVHNA